MKDLRPKLALAILYALGICVAFGWRVAAKVGG